MQKRKGSEVVRIRDLARHMVIIGARAFGGWSTTAQLLEERLVRREKLLTAAQLRAAIVYAQALPGATQVAIVASIGYRVCGLRGSIVATISYLLPAALLMVSFAYVYFHIGHLELLHRASVGVGAALGGIVMANALRLGRQHASLPYLWLITWSIFVLRLYLHSNAALLILGTGACGLLVFWLRKKVKHETS